MTSRDDIRRGSRKTLAQNSLDLQGIVWIGCVYRVDSGLPFSGEVGWLISPGFAAPCAGKPAFWNMRLRQSSAFPRSGAAALAVLPPRIGHEEMKIRNAGRQENSPDLFLHSCLPYSKIHLLGFRASPKRRIPHGGMRMRRMQGPGMRFGLMIKCPLEAATGDRRHIRDGMLMVLLQRTRPRDPRTRFALPRPARLVGKWFPAAGGRSFPSYPDRLPM